MMQYTEGQITLKQPFPIEVGEWLIRQPEAKMWAVCLSHAICGAVGIIRSNDLNKYREHDRYWLIRDKRHHVGSCSWICELLGISRKRLISYVWKNRHVLKNNPYRLRSVC